MRNEQTAIPSRIRDILASFNPRQPFKPSNPEVLFIGCADPREGAGHHFDLGDTAVRETIPGLAIPPYRLASVEMKATFALCARAGVKEIVLVAHSDCGANKAAVTVPEPDPESDDETHLIAACVARMGLDIPNLKGSFMLATGNDFAQTADLLARHVVVESVGNLCGFPKINEQVMAGKLNIVSAFHDMQNGRLEYYDVGEHRWKIIGDAPHEVPDHFCTRPHDCGQCASCGDQIGNALRPTHDHHGVPWQAVSVIRRSIEGG